MKTGRIRGVPVLMYGNREIRDYLPKRVIEDDRLIPIEPPTTTRPLADVNAALRRALAVSTTPELVPALRRWLATRYRGGDVTIVLDDHTRPCAHQRVLLPPLLRWLLAHGVEENRIRLLIATATHRATRDDEFPHVLGAAWPAWRERVLVHDDLHDLERLGTMSDGVPVEMNGHAARSEVVLGLSDLDYHYFAGVTGGPKQIVPGIAGRALTTADHLRMFGPLGFAPGCDMGILDGNPVVEYKRAAMRIVLDSMRARRALVYGVMAVLDPRERFVALVGGDILAAHSRIRPVLDRVYAARIPRRASVAIVSARHLGLNVYQAGKAINAATRAVADGGRVLCLAPCPDGFGNDEFRGLMALAAPHVGDPDTTTRDGIDRALRIVQDAVEKDFRIGKQKPVDLLMQYRHVGPGHLYLLCDGLSDADRHLLPFRYVGGSAQDPGKRLRSWIDDQERLGSPTYAIIDDPTYWIRVGDDRSDSR